jgi:hypothetical protein
MTWGSNASFRDIPCRFCGQSQTDDTDEGLSTHESACEKRPLNRIKAVLPILLLRRIGKQH